ncbi:MAG: extracellular elastinolytic metalloproteinase, partial [Solirubrobacteraceae bacterium]|nr:extracellular elastinolytic metalloproteinase [Solirubrobacteraceae bacterium]
MRVVGVATAIAGSLALAVPGAHAAIAQTAGAKPFFDARESAGAPSAARPSAKTQSARTDMQRSLGTGGVIDIDPLTGTPRQLIDTEGALSASRGGTRNDIALDYVRANLAPLGLTSADVDGLSAPDVVTGTDGLKVVHYQQLYKGIPAFDNDLRVAVDSTGRVISVGGSPRHDLSVADVSPALSASDAMAKAQADAGVSHAETIDSAGSGPRQATTFKNGDSARLVLFGGAGGAKLAWHVIYQATGDAVYDDVIDADSGALLYRGNLVKGVANAHVYQNHPGESSPGVPGPITVDLNSPTYGLPNGALTLQGKFSRAYSDLNDDNQAGPTEEVIPSSGSDFIYDFQPVSPAGDTSCTATKPCTWDPTVPTSWVPNRRQNTVQAFYLVSRFHTHLTDPAIGFDDADGNFEVGGTGGSDPVLTEALDGAARLNGGPDNSHIDNANMATFPDGQSPRMQMYLFANTLSDALDFRSMNGGDDSGVVWHEYTHGLSNRLIVNADGTGALNAPQSGAMGEAWSDWYASDYQTALGLKSDNLATPGDIDVGAYSDADPHALRTQALDCPVGALSAACPGGVLTSVGGYTYGDFGAIAGAPEVHADGEIWSETLWDLRQRLQVKFGDAGAGSDFAEILVSDGMRLSPPEPTYLDMRNAILAADNADFGGALHDLVWDVFRHRGMGYL